MLQLANVSLPIVDDLVADRVGEVSGAALERLVDESYRELSRRRREAVRRRGGVLRLADAVDRALRTDEPELMDRDDVPESTKLRLVKMLHVFNRIVGSYRRFLRVLTPELDRARRRTGRTPRLLELASGAGELALAVAGLAGERGLDVEVTGSDVVGAQVRHANAEARRRGLAARFVEIDALDMSAVPPGRYDVVFVAQSLHHFSPGVLARVIEQGSRAATTTFVGVDGRRGPGKLLIVPGPTWLVPWTAPFHDAFVTSRKLYSEPELELIARLAAHGRAVRVRGLGNAFSVVTVEGAASPA